MYAAAMSAQPLAAAPAVPVRGQSAARAGGGAVGEAFWSREVAERVTRIPVRAPLALPSAGFPLFLPEALASASSRRHDTEAASALTAEAATPAVEAFAPAAAPRSGVVRKRTESVYYEVDGVSRAALAAALRERGPELFGQQFFGMTEWEVSAGYRPVEGAAGCAIDDLTVQVEITTHLPQWRRAAAAPQELKGAWDQFLSALDRHEHGHRALAEEAAEAIRHRLLSVSTPACDRLDPMAQREMSAVMREYEARNLAYDSETGHGRTQGAVWPPR